MIHTLLARLPLSEKGQVAVGVVGTMGFCYLTFFGFKPKKAGHNIFDVEKPEAVQQMIDDVDEAKSNRMNNNK